MLRGWFLLLAWGNTVCPGSTTSLQELYVSRTQREISRECSATYTKKNHPLPPSSPNILAIPILSSTNGSLPGSEWTRPNRTSVGASITVAWFRDNESRHETFFAGF